MKCISDSAYAMCNRGYWGVSQNCGPQTKCSAVGDYIYCIPSSTPASTPAPVVTPAPAPAPVPVPVPAPVVTPAPVPVPTSTPSTPTAASGSCVLGYQVCYGGNMYQTCGNGRDGPVWAAPQACRTGLSCHPSVTANNIYCY